MGRLLFRRSSSEFLWLHKIKNLDLFHYLFPTLTTVLASFRSECTDLENRESTIEFQHGDKNSCLYGRLVLVIMPHLH